MDELLYLQAETSGDRPEDSHIIVLSCGAFKDGEFRIRQLLLDRPQKEKLLLSEFADHLQCFSALVLSGDAPKLLPYLKTKYRNYGLSDPFFRFRKTGVYPAELTKDNGLSRVFERRQPDKEYGPSPEACGLSSLCVSSSDPKELYLSYLLGSDPSGLEKLSRINASKLRSLYAGAAGLQSLQALTAGGFTLTNVEEGAEGLYLFFQTDEGPGITFQNSFVKIEKAAGICILPAVSETLRYYFDDWKDYYYLPAEGYAVHKSIGCYVEASHREKATKDTAFSLLTGTFFLQPEKIVDPAYYREAPEGPCFFRSGDASAEDLKQLICRCLKEPPAAPTGRGWISVWSADRCPAP